MLNLTAAAIVVDIMRAAGIHAVRRRFHELFQSGSREAFVLA